MSLTISIDLLEATKCEALAKQRDRSARFGYNKEEIDLNLSILNNEDLVDLVAAAEATQDMKTRRALEAILGARAGKHDLKVPSFLAFESMLRCFLGHNIIDGWLYVRCADGALYPYLVKSITHSTDGGYRGKGASHVSIVAEAYTLNAEGRREPRLMIATRSFSFYAGDVANKRVSDILADRGIFKETHGLKSEFDASMNRHEAEIYSGFSKQYRVNGCAFFYEDDDHSRRGEKLVGRRVIHDTVPSEQGARKNFDETEFSIEGVGPIPEHPLVRCFDLKSHQFYWVRSDSLSLHQYDKSVAEKLILPDSHRDLLEVLTTDLDVFTSDFIEGKAAGNVVLCKGVPGVGKTATAECYSEIMEVPLYSINTGTLGTSPEDIHRNLDVIFQRAKRWSSVLVLDEADVFVMKRGDDVVQNAIVAEFLRVLEYYAGLLFLTTNRPNDVDEAIISRCVAIIEFTVPDKRLAAKVWEVMGENYESPLSPELIEQLVDLFPEIAPRDIKMLLRLVLKVARKRDQPLDIELFRRTAMFRAVHMAKLPG